jgi:dipeptidyl aminopeptidase/acylaminoacyl peptidase
MKPLFMCAVIVTFFLPSGIGAAGPGSEKPPVTFDEFFDSVTFGAVRISPDGDSIAIQADRADWDANRFRSDLWLYRGGQLAPLTQSGRDHSPQWSPDGRWIAFLSDRTVSVPKTKEEREEAEMDAESAEEKEVSVDQIYVISVAGGEAFPVTEGEEAVHGFAWSADSRAIYFAAQIELTTEQKKDLKKDWKDVVRYRESERGDVIQRVGVASIQAERANGKILEEYSDQTKEITKTADRAKGLTVSPNGERLAFLSEPRSARQESLDEYGIYVLELGGKDTSPAPRPISRGQAAYDSLRWAKDSRHVLFGFESGALDTGSYQDAQPRLYWADTGEPGAKETAKPTRWAPKFDGAITGYNVLPNGELLVEARNGTEVQPYTASDAAADPAKQKAWPGTYEEFSTAQRSPRIAFVYSTLEKPNEVYVADSVSDFSNAHAITSFNHVFTERALPSGKPYRWTADDGASVEGMLIYPPGKMGARNLRMLTLIHGGPEDADGDHFEADWYQWAILAATNGWLVFEPNYRGSVGYGDAFALGIIPHIVSRPGKDILEGVDALVKDGIADPNRLTVGGYSYGGYMTNWLITQTTRFKAAVTGAGAVEHVANWGNDDTTMDDAYFLGGRPWEAESNYNAEAAIWQFEKVTTPTHVVGGADDIRVYVGEDYLLERALHARGIPTSLLIFPGEGHSLDKDPWHGKIKVRDELNWLEKYAEK